MKFVSKYIIFSILVFTLINICLCVNPEGKENNDHFDTTPPKIIKRCPGHSENLSRQNEIEVSNFVIFFFILSYFYTNYL